MRVVYWLITLGLIGATMSARGSESDSHEAALLGLVPPIEITSAMYVYDGGSRVFSLKDALNRELKICLKAGDASGRHLTWWGIAPMTSGYAGPRLAEPRSEVEEAIVEVLKQWLRRCFTREEISDIKAKYLEMSKAEWGRVSEIQEELGVKSKGMMVIEVINALLVVETRNRENWKTEARTLNFPPEEIASYKVD